MNNNFEQVTENEFDGMTMEEKKEIFNRSCFKYVRE